MALTGGTDINVCAASLASASTNSPRKKCYPYYRHIYSVFTIAIKHKCLVIHKFIRCFWR